MADLEYEIATAIPCHTRNSRQCKPIKSSSEENRTFYHIGNNIDKNAAFDINFFLKKRSVFT